MIDNILASKYHIIIRRWNTRLPEKYTCWHVILCSGNHYRSWNPATSFRRRMRPNKPNVEPDAEHLLQVHGIASDIKWPDTTRQPMNRQTDGPIRRDRLIDTTSKNMTGYVCSRSADPKIPTTGQIAVIKINIKPPLHAGTKQFDAKTSRLSSKTEW